MKSLINFINESVNNTIIDKFVNSIIEYDGAFRPGDKVIRALIASFVDRDLYDEIVKTIKPNEANMSQIGRQFEEEYIDDETYEYMTDEKNIRQLSFDDVYDRYLELSHLK